MTEMWHELCAKRNSKNLVFRLTAKEKSFAMHSHLMKIGLALVVFAILLFARSPLHAQEENPWKFLSDFEFIEGVVSPVQDGYVATILHNATKGLFALVFYPGECRGGNCVVGSPTAFIAVDSPGRIVKLHLEPGMKLESIILGFQIS